MCILCGNAKDVEKRGWQRPNMNIPYTHRDIFLIVKSGNFFAFLRGPSLNMSLSFKETEQRTQSFWHCGLYIYSVHQEFAFLWPISEAHFKVYKIRMFIRKNVLVYLHSFNLKTKNRRKFLGQTVNRKKVVSKTSFWLLDLFSILCT